MSRPAVRPYRDSDRAAAIEALAGIQEHERRLHDTRRPAAEMVEPYFARLRGRVAEQSGAMLVAEIGGSFAGFVACFVVADNNPAETPDSNRFGYVSDLYVAPERRGGGVAQLLLAAAERHLAETGVTRLRVGVLAANQSARRAYEAYGLELYEAIYEKRMGVSTERAKASS